MTLPPEAYVGMIYRHLLGREADPSGLEHFAGLLRAGERLETVIDAVLGCDEYAIRHRAVDRPHDYGAKQADPIRVVDLGAQDLFGEEHVYAPLLRGGLDWRCVGFEPQRDKADERARADASGRLTMHARFIGDGSRHMFHLNSDSGSSSLLPLNHEFNRSFDDICGFTTSRTELVKTERLDDVLDEPYVDFLKLDIQGFELEALRGARRTLAGTNVVHCEVHFAQMYLGAPYFSQVETLLRDAGFEFVDFDRLTRYEYVDVPQRTGRLDRLIWGEAVFFRRLTPGLDPWRHFWAQSAIASLVYAKHGLAQKIWATGVAADDPSSGEGAT